MKLRMALAFTLAVLLGMGGNALALDVGKNITISDNIPANSTANEDNEVEPGNMTGQQWDLEAFFLEGNTLTVVGGFDFKNGVRDPYYSSDPTHRLPTYHSGDIFIDTNGNVNYGAPLVNNNGSAGGGPVTLSNSLFGYEYVIDLDFSTLTFDIYKLNDSSLFTVYFDQNSDSNPWAYASGGTAVTGYQDVLFAYFTGLANSAVGGMTLWNGQGTHNAFTVDLSFLPADTDFIAHFTMECGNDNLMGKGQTVPEPGTMLLLGSGLLGLVGLRRKFRR